MRFERKDTSRPSRTSGPRGKSRGKDALRLTQGGEPSRTTKGAKFGKDILTADLHRLSQIYADERSAQSEISYQPSVKK